MKDDDAKIYNIFMRGRRNIYMKDDVKSYNIFMEGQRTKYIYG